MFKALTKLFFNKKSKDELLVVEGKYFEKYNDILNKERILQLIEEYKSGIIVFEPIRNTLTEQEQDELYSKIDNANLLNHQERFETIIGLMMVLDGSFPDDIIVTQLGKVFGKEFMDTIIQKRNEFKNEIIIKRVVKYLKNK